MTDDPVIEASGLRRVFKSRKGDVEAVAGIELAVRRAEIFGFLGPNGAGKTTTLRMLATLLPPTSGEARVAGADLRRDPQKVRERIGYVGQRGSTDPGISGRRELVLQARLYGASRAQAGRAAAADACARVAAPDRSDKIRSPMRWTPRGPSSWST